MPDGLLFQISQTLAAARTIEELTRPLLTLLELVSGLESTYLTRIDQIAGVQDVLFARNSKTMQIPEGLSVPWADTLCKRALDEGRTCTDDVATLWGDSEAARALGIQTYVSMPVHLGNGSLFGTLCAASNEKRPITEEGQQVLSLFATLISQHIERESLIKDLQKANAALETYSFTDMLTGLPNRRMVMSELGRLFGLAGRTGQKVLVAFVDLDGFKHINDTYGHEIGDEFLIEIGRRLSTGLRSGDMLGRLEGDEFVIVGLGPFAGCDPVRATEAMRDRLRALTKGRYAFGPRFFDYPGASFGVTAADPATDTPEEALRRADTAMYEEKRARKSLVAAG